MYEHLRGKQKLHVAAELVDYRPIVICSHRLRVPGSCTPAVAVQRAATFMAQLIELDLSVQIPPTLGRDLDSIGNRVIACERE